jgi:hypothetical protein
MATDVLDNVDLAGAVVTPDALHTVKAPPTMSTSTAGTSCSR